MKDEKELINQYSIEIQSGVSFGGLFSTLTIFFTGLLISNYNSFPTTVRFPLLFLILSTFGFIYATLIYANASNSLNSSNLSKCKKALNTADVLSEFMGVYTLLISIPLVIPIVSNDSFLIISVLIADAMGLLVYHLSGFSIMKDFYPKSHQIIAIIVIALIFIMFYLLKTNQIFLMSSVVISTLLFLVLLSLYTVKKLSQVD